MNASVNLEMVCIWELRSTIVAICLFQQDVCVANALAKRKCGYRVKGNTKPPTNSASTE